MYGFGFAVKSLGQMRICEVSRREGLAKYCSCWTSVYLAARVRLERRDLPVTPRLFLRLGPELAASQIRCADFRSQRQITQRIETV